ncbi:hypothetical protein [Streptomyces sp. CB01881]|uniref:hypothetical protein n=1 Tax=Streptomyces sp. CB01881 TaxID=2078691 RepID=UPI0011DFD4A0|nr:hypothetical protein [Streptomyces sp. CB01881]TYC69298.1 hypothetical protein EH183_34330 [Streptomyces sp. CB01881]
MTDGALLDLWESASAVAPVGRPLALLTAAFPHCRTEDLAAEPLGRCDALLAELRASLVGDGVEAVAGCPSCGGLVETAFSLGALGGDGGPDTAAELTTTVAGHDVHCRPVTLGDLIAVCGLADAESALIARCAEIRRAGAAVPPEHLPQEVRAAVEEAMAAVDPRAETLLGLSCPACDTQWWAAFDLAAFLWTEVERLAQCLLVEVDTLARAYGWRESDILALGALRRRRYLDLVTS